jgi:hypothetical protein
VSTLYSILLYFLEEPPPLSLSTKFLSLRNKFDVQQKNVTPRQSRVNRVSPYSVIVNEKWKLEGERNKRVE